VPNVDKEDSKLDRDGKLRDIGVVVEYLVGLKEFYKSVKDQW
jgi:hypothetical protein